MWKALWEIKENNVWRNVVCLLDKKSFRVFLEKVINEAVNLEVSDSPAKLFDQDVAL